MTVPTPPRSCSSQPRARSAMIAGVVVGVGCVVGPTTTAFQCEVEVMKLAALGDEWNGSISFPFAVRRNASGQLLVVVEAEQASVLIFDERGAYQGRMGGPGEGPGEFRTITHIHEWRGDSISVWDIGNSRMQIYPQDLGVPRIRPVRILPRAGLVLPDGRLFVNAILRNVEQSGYALHELGANGAVRASFDGTNSFRWDRPDVHRRALTVSAHGGFWAASQTRYQITRWSADGEILQDFRRAVEWFPDNTYYGLHWEDQDRSPAPGLIDVYEDDRGLLWTLIHVPADEWRAGLDGPLRRGMYGQMLPSIDRNAMWDTVLEVLDPSTESVVARQSVDEALLGWADAGVAYSYRENEAGVPLVDIWQASLTLCKEES